MKNTHIGIRELKANISKILKQVKAGKSIVITERGKPVGRIVPAEHSIRARLESLAEAGLVQWSGKKLAPAIPPVSNPGNQLLSDVVSDLRV
jgi:prevent-host-death family protein